MLASISFSCQRLIFWNKTEIASQELACDDLWLLWLYKCRGHLGLKIATEQLVIPRTLTDIEIPQTFRSKIPMGQSATVGLLRSFKCQRYLGAINNYGTVRDRASRLQPYKCLTHLWGQRLLWNGWRCLERLRT